MIGLYVVGHEESRAMTSASAKKAANKIAAEMNRAFAILVEIEREVKGNEKQTVIFRSKPMGSLPINTSKTNLKDRQIDSCESGGSPQQIEL